MQGAVATAGSGGSAGSSTPAAPSAMNAAGAGAAGSSSAAVQGNAGSTPPAPAGTAGSASPGGSAGSGGSSTAGTAGSAPASDAGSPAATGTCDGDPQLNPAPFGCSFAWGANGNDGGRDAYLDFITTWVGYEWTQNRAQECDGCKLAAELAGKQAVAVYYAYFIGSTLPDCNEQPSGMNLCTDGARYIRDHRQQIIDIYAWYAKQTFMASPNKGVAWLLEGDFMQYTEDTQSAPLSLQELGALARDITCAIRESEPNATVAINHITWNSDEETDDYWHAMPLADIDFVWTTGVGNNAGFFGADTNASSYNAKTATYRYVHELTKKPIWVDTSFGLSQQSDSWTGVAPADLNQRIGEGVFAVNVTQPPSDYSARLTTLRSALDTVCR